MEKKGVQLVVLGNVQDGGAPHIGCARACCQSLWNTPNEALKVVSLGILDYEHDQVGIIEATPDFPEQMAYVNALANRSKRQMPDGIFITHAHIGHYTGLMYLGREAMGATGVPVWVMPRMFAFLSNNGPWDQLIHLENMVLDTFEMDTPLQWTPSVQIVPVLVPHRDEYSETVGFKILGPSKSVLFIPDIDKWSKWELDIREVVSDVDVAFLDATFFDAKEVGNRDMAEIPHPFVLETMELFQDVDIAQKKKIHFIHLNHTNPLLKEESEASLKVETNGFNVARFGDVFDL